MFAPQAIKACFRRGARHFAVVVVPYVWFEAEHSCSPTFYLKDRRKMLRSSQGKITATLSLPQIMAVLYIKASEIKQESMTSKIKMRTLCVMSRLEEVGMGTFSLGFLDDDWIIGKLSLQARCLEESLLYGDNIQHMASMP